MTDETITYRRAELYEEVWKEPVRTVARRYGVSGVALGNICRKLRVPLPARGDWARIRVGQKIRRPPLPDGPPSEIVAQKWKPRDARPAPPAVEPSEPPIVVPAELHDPHKLVSEAARLLRSQKPHEGLTHCWGTRCLDIAVAPASLGRALRIMDALIRALEKRGLQVEVTRPLSYEERSRRSESEAPSNATRVMVSGEWIQFGITEKRSVTHPPVPEQPKGIRGPELQSWIWQNQPRTELVPNGTFELSINNGLYLGARRLWHDGKRKRVEDCLNDFIAHLPVMADAIKRYREGLERARRERQEEESRRWEEEQRRREEAERIKRLEDKLHRWRLARDTREYVAEVREIIASEGAIAVGSQLEESLKWAEAFAKRIDPVTRLRADIAPPHPGARRETEEVAEHEDHLSMIQEAIPQYLQLAEAGITRPDVLGYPAAACLFAVIDTIDSFTNDTGQNFRALTGEYFGFRFNQDQLDDLYELGRSPLVHTALIGRWFWLYPSDSDGEAIKFAPNGRIEVYLPTLLAKCKTAARLFLERAPTIVLDTTGPLVNLQKKAEAYARKARPRTDAGGIAGSAHASGVSEA